MEYMISFYRDSYAWYHSQSIPSYPHIYKMKYQTPYVQTLLYTICSIIVLLHHFMFALIRSSLNLADISPLFSLEMSRDNAATCVTAKEVLGDDVLDTHDMTTVSEPMEESISENIDESNERHNV
jgi:hypothetical protein